MGDIVLDIVLDIVQNRKRFSFPLLSLINSSLRNATNHIWYIWNTHEIVVFVCLVYKANLFVKLQGNANYINIHVCDICDFVNVVRNNHVSNLAS